MFVERLAAASQQIKLQTILDDERNPRRHPLFSRRQTMGYADGPVKPVSYGALSHEQYTKSARHAGSPMRPEARGPAMGSSMAFCGVDARLGQRRDLLFLVWGFECQGTKRAANVGAQGLELGPAD
jgi:hypothetical protein